ncbi:MAG: DsbA family protein [Sporolactobacillus sp.]
MTRCSGKMVCEGTNEHMTCSIVTNKAHFSRVEILSFIDPICARCWGIEPLMKKFLAEYHRYFTLRYLLTTQHDTANRYRFCHAKAIAKEWDRYAQLTGTCCDSDIWYENPPSPYAIALAIKAAEFQGQNAGHRFLRRLREKVFLCKEGLTTFDDFLQIAEQVGLSGIEFTSDFHSCRSVKAIQSDRRLANELAITELPSFVFSTPEGDNEAIKINGSYSYEVYVNLLTELIGESLNAEPLPPLIDYFQTERFLTTREAAVVYGQSEETMLKTLRELQLQHLVEPVTVKSGTYWKYIDKTVHI